MIWRAKRLELDYIFIQEELQVKLIYSCIIMEKLILIDLISIKRSMLFRVLI